MRGRLSTFVGAFVLGSVVGFGGAPVAVAAPVSAEEANSDQLVAYQVVDGFWRQHWSDYFRGSYGAPNLLGLYDSRIAPVPCADEYWTSNNAWYCGATDTIGFDLAFMERVHQWGDSFIYLVVAHEWGHAIQARLRPGVRAVAYELQADCLAGAALFGATRDGALQWDDGDAAELRYALTQLGDEFPWTRPGDHGSADQRIAHFVAGADGPEACLDRADGPTSKQAGAPR